MNSIWNKNISAFRVRFPSLAEIYKDFCTDICPISSLPWEISVSKSGEPTATQNALHLHSLYNPSREAFSAISNAEVNAKSTTVFLGFGLGYHVIEWAKNYKEKSADKKLILIEPDPFYFFASLSILDWTSVFSVKNLIIAIACPVDNIMQLLENPAKINMGNEGVSDSYFFNNKAFTQHAAQYFETVTSLIERNKRKNEINAATYKKFGKLWTKNTNKNLHWINECTCVNDIAKKLSSTNTKPFLLVAAGPTLEAILPHMAELKKRTVIVCVETALRAMLKVGVEPHFIILTDPQYWAYRHIAGLCAPNSVLITEVSTYPSVFHFSCKKIVLCASQFPIGQKYEQEHELNLGDLGAGGSVASAAWNFAKLCGAKEIFTSGLDLAFPKNQTHIKGSSAEQTFHTVSNRLKTVENFTIGTLYSANAQMGTDYNNQPVLTDSRMQMFAWWFESRLAACPEVKTYTLSPDGLKIPGIHPISVNELLARPL